LNHSAKQVARSGTPRLATPTDLGANATKDLSTALNALLADVFTLYMKTKNFHWHVSGPHFRDYHLLLDEQAGELLGMTDVLAERVRKLGGHTLRSIGDIARNVGSLRITRLMWSRRTCSPSCATTISA